MTLLMESENIDDILDPERQSSQRQKLQSNTDSANKDDVSSKPDNLSEVSN